MNDYQEFLQDKEQKKNAIKELLQRLHAGEDPVSLKEEFRSAIDGLMPDEIAAVEGELIESGVPPEEVHKLCDVHLEIFKENLQQTEAIAPPGHPVHILMDEHRLQMEYTSRLKSLANDLQMRGAVGATIAELDDLIAKIGETESHYAREETVLFPYLEKHGITQPPQIMWTEHDTVRGLRKDLVELVKKLMDYHINDRGSTGELTSFVGRLQELTVAIAESLESNIYKENNILLPTSLKKIDNGEWNEIREQFDELGYCSYTPEPPAIEFGTGDTSQETQMQNQQQRSAAAASAGGSASEQGFVEFATGRLSFTEIEAIFDSLPVDVTFVGADDTVRYFSQSPERVFPRAKAIIGRTVQNCHPQKSLHMVSAILDGFRAGKKEPAAFWIDMGGMKVYIRYFPVRDKEGNYLGCLEVTQDIAPIQKITGEKRLL